MSATGPIEHVIISFDTGNAAFRGPGNPEDPDYTDDRWVLLETMVLLNSLMQRAHRDGELRHDMPLIDSNGATVGVVTITRGQA